MNLLHIYGEGLPNTGLLFQVPDKVHQYLVTRAAFAAAHKAYPSKLELSVGNLRRTHNAYRNRYSTGELSGTDAWAMTSFRGRRFKWVKTKFIPA